MTLNLDKEWRQDQMDPGAGPFQDSRLSGTRRLWVAFGVLLAALIGASFYGYQTLKKENIQLSRIPELLNSTEVLGQQVGELEKRVSAFAADWSEMSEKVGKLERQVRGGVAGARKHAESLTARLEARILDQMDERDYVINSRLGHLEEGQKTGQRRLAELQRELSTTRQQLAEARGETDRDLSHLRAQLARSDGEFQTFAGRFEQRRVDFEVSRNRVHELAPGVTLKVTDMNPRYQQYKGWVFFQPDARTLWLKDQSVQRPVVFYSKEDGQRYELVVTNIREDSAVGYLLTPAGEPTPQQARPALRDEQTSTGEREELAQALVR
jgi:hypothetical protein